MSGISPSLLHSIKLKQSAPVKELVAFLTLGGQPRAEGCLVSSVPEAVSGIIKKKEIELIFMNSTCNAVKIL